MIDEEQNLGMVPVAHSPVVPDKKGNESIVIDDEMLDGSFRYEPERTRCRVDEVQLQLQQVLAQLG